MPQYGNFRDIYCDMHTHTNHSIDGKCTPDEMCEAAARLGLAAYNISDHCDVNRDRELHCYERSMASIADALRLKAEYAGKMKVLVGIEIGNPHWNPQLAKKCAGIEGIDCITGSVHRILYDGEELVTSAADFAAMTAERISGLIIKYFEDIILMLDTLRPDILAHPTYMFRYIVSKRHVKADISGYRKYTDAILKRIIREGTALEINTNLITDRLADYDIYLAERYFELGGRLVTLGSDAHTADRIANGFIPASAELKRIGFKNACSIEERTIKCYKL